jgi:hypothetical protein
MKTKKAAKQKEFLDLSTKEKALLIFKKYGDDIPIDQLIEELYLYQKIGKGLQDVRAGRVIDHDEVFRELLGEDEEA